MIFLTIFLSIIFAYFLVVVNYENLKFQRTNFSPLEFLISFILILLALNYILIIFGNNILFYINMICFLGLYISSVFDIKNRIIYPFIIFIFSIPIIFLNYLGNYIKISIFGLISGFLLYLSIYVFGKIIYKKEVFGIGDIYILSFIGLATDYFTVLNIGLFSFVICLIYYILKMLFKNKITKDYEIPFVPFITISYLLLIYF